MRKMRTDLYAALFLIFFSGVIIAQTGYGASSLSLTGNSITIYPGNSATLGFNVTLASGYTWGTEVRVINNNSEINASISPSIGDPSYSGNIAISVSGNILKGTYPLVFYASGDDPSTNNVTLIINVPISGTYSHSNSTTTHTSGNSTIATFRAIASNTILVNASSSRSFNVTVGNISVTVLPGTYMQEGSKTFSIYNFTLITFSFKNLSSPSLTYLPTYAYAFEANHEINASISFVDFSGNPRAPISIVRAPSSLTSWTYFGGTFNSSTGIYSGGSYLGEDKWIHNINGTMANTQFFKPVLWVFAEPLPYNQTTTINQTSQTPQSSTPTITNMYILAAIILIVIIILIIVFFRMKGR